MTKAPMILAYNAYQFVDGSGGTVDPSVNTPTMIVKYGNNQIYSYIFYLADPALTLQGKIDPITLKAPTLSLINVTASLFNFENSAYQDIGYTTYTLRTNRNSQLVIKYRLHLTESNSTTIASVKTIVMDIISATGDFEGAKTAQIDFQIALTKYVRPRIITVTF